jgi:hypothetical protein
MKSHVFVKGAKPQVNIFLLKQNIHIYRISEKILIAIYLE